MPAEEPLLSASNQRPLKFRTPHPALRVQTNLQQFLLPINPSIHKSINPFLALWLALAFGGLPLLVKAQSSRPGMGSIPYSDASGSGVTFRVWAPDATNVSVPGEFNKWSTISNLLVRETGSDPLVADIPNAKNGDQYKYFINGFLYKIDPRARKVVNSAGNGIIYDPNAYNWSGDARPTPPGNVNYFRIQIVP